MGRRAPECCAAACEGRRLDSSPSIKLRLAEHEAFAPLHRPRTADAVAQRVHFYVELYKY